MTDPTYPGFAACEGSIHDDFAVPAVAMLSLSDSCGMANVTTVCAACLQVTVDAFLDEQASGLLPDAFEIRPLAIWPKATEWPIGVPG